MWWSECESFKGRLLYYLRTVAVNNPIDIYMSIALALALGLVQPCTLGAQVDPLVVPRRVTIVVYQDSWPRMPHPLWQAGRQAVAGQAPRIHHIAMSTAVAQ